MKIRNGEPIEYFKGDEKVEYVAEIQKEVEENGKDAIKTLAKSDIQFDIILLDDSFSTIVPFSVI